MFDKFNLYPDDFIQFNLKKLFSEIKKVNAPFLEPHVRFVLKFLRVVRIDHRLHIEKGRNKRESSWINTHLGMIITSLVSLLAMTTTLIKDINKIGQWDEDGTGKLSKNNRGNEQTAF